MKPSFWSTKANLNLDDGESGWNQEACGDCGYDTSLYNQEINALNPHKLRTYYSLSFDYKFEYPNDEVFVAYTVPYTYTQMLSHIKALKTLADDYRKLDYTLRI